MERLLLVGLLLTTVLQAEASGIRLKTFREILSSLETATNIELRDPLLVKLYEERKATLPQTGKLEEFNSIGVATFFGLTSHFCQKMIDADITKNPADRWAHADIDFALPAGQALTPMVQSNLVSTYGELFWLRVPDLDETKHLEELMSTSILLFGDMPGSTREVLKVTCSVMGGSLASLIVEK